MENSRKIRGILRKTFLLLNSNRDRLQTPGIRASGMSNLPRTLGRRCPGPWPSVRFFFIDCYSQVPDFFFLSTARFGIVRVCFTIRDAPKLTDSTSSMTEAPLQSFRQRKCIADGLCHNELRWWSAPPIWKLRAKDFGRWGEETPNKKTHAHKHIIITALSQDLLVIILFVFSLPHEEHHPNKNTSTNVCHPPSPGTIPQICLC